jgi:hypothetical protein
MEATLKPPALPSLLTSTVPGFGVLHMLQVLRRAQLVFPQPLHVQSPGANIPTPHLLACHQICMLGALKGACRRMVSSADQHTSATLHEQWGHGRLQVDLRFRGRARGHRRHAQRPHRHRPRAWVPYSGCMTPCTHGPTP